jgi:hypothetical protein
MRGRLHKHPTPTQRHTRYYSQLTSACRHLTSRLQEPSKLAQRHPSPIPGIRPDQSQPQSALKLPGPQSFFASLTAARAKPSGAGAGEGEMQGQAAGDSMTLSGA